MPRQPGLDAPGALAPCDGRSLEGRRVFANDADRADVLGRLADLCRGRAVNVYAWAFLPNPCHLLVAPGSSPSPTV